MAVDKKPAERKINTLIKGISIEALNLSDYDRRKLRRICAEHTLNRDLFGDLRGHQKIDLAPFFENPHSYIGKIPKEMLLAKCLIRINRLYEYYLALPCAKETVAGFIDEMNVTPHPKGLIRFSMAFRYYRKAIFQLTNTFNPIVGRLEALKLYGLAEAHFQIISLLREERLGRKLKIADAFMKKDKARDSYIGRLLKDNPGVMYKSLWCDADKGIIGEMELRRFENICSEIKGASKKKVTQESRFEP